MYYFSWVEEDEIDLGIYSKTNKWWWMGTMLRTMKEGFKKWKQDTYLFKKY
jgi:hypothetical protein